MTLLPFMASTISVRKWRLDGISSTRMRSLSNVFCDNVLAVEYVSQPKGCPHYLPQPLPCPKTLPRGGLQKCGNSNSWTVNGRWNKIHYDFIIMFVLLRNKMAQIVVVHLERSQRCAFSIAFRQKWRNLVKRYLVQ